MAEAQARERAQELADQLAQAVAVALKEPTAADVTLEFEVNQHGALIFPPPLAPAEIPQPFVLADLSAAQAAAWETAQRHEWNQQLPEALIAYDKFLELKPPKRFAAAARYSRGLLWRKQSDARHAAEEFGAVAREFPAALSESGVSFSALAQLNLIELAPERALAISETLGSNLVSRPTVLSQQILRRVATHNESAAGHWLQLWDEHERARTLFRAARPKLQSAQLFWASMGTNAFLLVKQQENTNSIRYVAWQDPVKHTLAEFANKLPIYFDFSLELAGQPIVSSNHVASMVKQVGPKGAGQWWEKMVTGTPPPVLSAATRSENGREYLKAAIHLTSPQLLYERQRDRALWFGLLIVATAGVAVAGYVSSLRAFQKQQRLAELKSNFVSSVSHELRAPIASVRLMAEGLERGTVSEEAKQREYFRFIVQECRRLSSLIENVLDFARIEQGRKQYDFEPTDLPTLLYHTAGVMKPYASEKQIELRVIANESEVTGPANVDGRAIQQALVNLIDNALKHSPAGSVVQIGLSPSREAVRLWVQDQGTGIPRAEHQKIFERFYRCGSELRRETQGVGIGLSIVKHIAEAHGGTVRVQSEPGKGSRFTIEIPVRSQPVELVESTS